MLSSNASFRRSAKDNQLGAITSWALQAGLALAESGKQLTSTDRFGDATVCAGFSHSRLSKRKMSRPVKFRWGQYILIIALSLNGAPIPFISVGLVNKDIESDNAECSVSNSPPDKDHFLDASPGWLALGKYLSMLLFLASECLLMID
ncbi:hypothetical protein MKZ38_008994 [Zalerion maritima]|uniref:Uncharacterized protein n=1 Tax=Zalerion maritima TaxID=339359 RepID=A0AAD5RH64_9PEZI|nr:hypothetical protein MKZ38_008994 [Zalerion maritima]